MDEQAKGNDLMAGSPQLKIYNPDGEYIASCKYGEDAAALMALYGNGAKIKYQHGVTVWTEGEEAQPASESYDYVAQVIIERRRAAHR